jgi:hypothetical protein
MSDQSASWAAIGLLHMASLKGDRVNPGEGTAVFESAFGSSFRAFEECQDLGWLDGDGIVTAIGREALGERPL